MRVPTLIIVMVSTLAVHSSEIALQLQKDEIPVSDSKSGWQLSGKYAIPSSLRYPYPAIAILETNTTLIGYADTSGKYRIRMIRDRVVSDFAELDCFPDHEQVGRLPQMMADARGLVVTSVSRDVSTADHTVDVVSLDADGKPTRDPTKIVLPKQRPFPKSKYNAFDAVIPINRAQESYLVIGEFTETYLSHGLIPIVPDPEGYRKNVAMTAMGSQLSPLNRIEERGRFYVSTADYAVLTNGLVHCGWIRCSGPTFSKEKTETVCYSVLLTNRWSNPKVIISEQGQNGMRFGDVAVAGTGKEALLVWARDRDGFYSVAVTNGNVSPPLRLSGWQDYDSLWAEGVATMQDAPCCDVCTDSAGDMFVVWALNRREKDRSGESGMSHKIALKLRTRGVWGPEVVLSRGDGLVRSPKVLADSYGRVHVAYLRQVGSQQFGCFYRSLANEELRLTR